MVINIINDTINYFEDKLLKDQTMMKSYYDQQSKNYVKMGRKWRFLRRKGLKVIYRDQLPKEREKDKHKNPIVLIVLYHKT